MSGPRTDDGDVELAVGAEHFRCVPYATTLRRGDCGARYTKINAPGAPQWERMLAARCMKCPVGAVHAKAKRHPDAPRVSLPILGSRSGPVGAPPKVEKPATGGELALINMGRRSEELRAAKRAGVKPPVHPPMHKPAAPPAPAPPAPAPTNETAPTSAPKEEPMAEKRKCAICGATFEPGRSTQRFCSSHTKAEKVAQWEKERGGASTSAPSAHKGGASAKAEKPARARKPRELRVSDPAIAPRADLAVDVLRALGFDVAQLDPAVFGEGRFVFSARAS